jgi:hypothetical protein
VPLKAEVFWNAVLDAYTTLSGKGAKDDDVILVQRESASIGNIFQRTLARQVKEWHPFYKRIAEALPSGTTKQDWVRMASEEYVDQYGRRFSNF